MIETTYCDHCGEEIEKQGDPENPRLAVVTIRPYRSFTEVPVNVASANAGESAVVCEECLRELGVT